ncbi:MAG: hypothetical protein JNM39_01430 [Bdellovibrionaceae bacterium]|jgi:L-cystine uptake protein TcyP (sodium:dicarboxylate symporter family)|nr:hypothetical protein [Pseudobdellovibrionaceae bacterium]
MSEFVTVTKIFILSFLILVALQVKWNGISIEKRALISLHQSQLGQTVEDVALGATKVIEKGSAWAKANFHKAAKSVSGSPAAAPPSEPAAANR